MLTIMLLTPIIGAVALLLVDDSNRAGVDLIKQITLITTIITFALSVAIWIGFTPGSAQYQYTVEQAQLGFMHLRFGVDGISLYYVLLTTFITPICILAS